MKPIELASPQNAPAYPGRRKARISGRFRPAVFILLAVIFLYLLTSLPLEMRSGIFHIKKIDLISAMSKSADASKRRQPANPSPRDAGSNQMRVSAKTGAPSAGSEAPTESALEREDPLQPIELFEDDALDPFFRVLRGLPRSSEPVRIAYYGDSIIEGDMLTRDLRLNLQAQFGGSGVGYLPITSELALFRNSIGHSFSPEWQSLSLLHADRPAPLGIAGMVFVPACQEDPEGGLFCTSWVEYRVVKSAEKSNRIQTVRLFYSHAPTSASVEYVADKAEPKTIDLQPGPEIQETILSPDPPARKIRITFTAGAGFNVYGASLEGEKGILLDNFAMRGNSGIPLIRIPNSQLSGFERLLRYRLIILHFGANVATPDPQDFSWYEIGLIKIIRHFQVSFPETAFLLVSCSDRSYKDGLDYVTIPTIPQLVETQRRAAQKTGIAFWNLYAAMGGENAMARWVDYRPSLAALDYTHFSLLGAKRIADDFYRALMDGYKRFEDKLGR